MDWKNGHKHRALVVIAWICVLVNNHTAANPVSTNNSQDTTVSNSNHFILDTANLDLNKDGCISGKAELDSFKQKVVEALSGTPHSVLRAHSIVHRTDVNRDGRICWCDFISIYLHEKIAQNKHSAPFLVLPDTLMFTQLDEDADGKLSGPEKEKLVKEFEFCLPHHEAESIVAAISEVLNKDDAIALEEFKKFFNIHKEVLPHTDASVIDKGNNP
ncbi:hypothetical protein BsWGS_23476 [Bradybaena similaris]